MFLCTELTRRYTIEAASFQAADGDRLRPDGAGGRRRGVRPGRQAAGGRGPVPGAGGPQPAHRRPAGELSQGAAAPRAHLPGPVRLDGRHGPVPGQEEDPSRAHGEAFETNGRTCC